MPSRAVLARTVTAALMLTATAGCGLTRAAADTTTAGGTYSAPLPKAINDLPVRAEKRAGYKRDKFNLWVDADRDGCNARYEVLIAESLHKPTVGKKCKLTGGAWLSYYDGKGWSDPQDLDIDHLVALAEAWDSGAHGWDAKRRELYANDLGDDRPLVAVTDDLNQAKGDADPAAWMPPLEKVRCRYVAEWVSVKHRWGLAADQPEVNALRRHAGGCGNVQVTVERA